MVQYLSSRRRGIGGPRTLAQAYTVYRRSLMAGTFKLRDREHDRIRRLDPSKVNWVDAYEWWKARDDSAP